MVRSVLVLALAIVNVVIADGGKLNRRFLGGGGVGGGAAGFRSSSSSSSQVSHSSSGFAAGGGGGGGGFNFGGVGLPAAFNPFGGLLNQISACQTSLVAGISSQAAFSQISQIATMFQQAIGSIQGCGTCGLAGQGLNAFGGIIQQITSGISSLIGRLQGIFPSMWQGLLSSAFQPFGNSLPGLLNFCNGVGLPVNNFFGGNFVQSLASLQIGSINQAFSQFGLI
uniref:Secreted protein n=1 Tax=Phakopsora pachyrhizi TaxID=170000 RepID=A0A0S1MJR2_PHAPC